MKRSQLVNIYKETISYGRRFGGRFDNSTSYEPEDLPDWDDIMAEPSKKGPGRGAPTYTPKVTVVNADTLSVAREAQEEDPDAKVLVLVNASEHCPGGGVITGSEAQEEDIYRCTNMFHCSNKNLYPIAPDHFIVTEGVTVFKDEEYALLDDPVEFDFITMPAVRKPGLIQGTYLEKSDRENMRLRIDLILRYAALESYDTLILGALGCGAFRNPPEDIAHMFKTAIDKHGGYFKKIVFAVLSRDKNKNYQTFTEVLVDGRPPRAESPDSDSD